MDVLVADGPAAWATVYADMNANTAEIVKIVPDFNAERTQSPLNIQVFETPFGRSLGRYREESGSCYLESK
ncbi:hypothetical protein [Amycolatopsis panacis]|uniref:hypothetical protein n=1 Tax=Amycolatopsis panacis TaxID=2340917 RepID=UPI0011C344EC|nr:hypothetical protein [Amycolatopsis panacis]